MNKEELLAEIDAVCMMLYQNNEHVAIGRISELLNIFQDMIQTLSQDQLGLIGDMLDIGLPEQAAEETGYVWDGRLPDGKGGFICIVLLWRRVVEFVCGNF